MIGAKVTTAMAAKSLLNARFLSPPLIRISYHGTAGSCPATGSQSCVAHPAPPAPSKRIQRQRPPRPATLRLDALSPRRFEKRRHHGDEVEALGADGIGQHPPD